MIQLSTFLSRPSPMQTGSDIVLEIQGLTKRYGNTVAVQSLDLSLPRGKVLGFLGPNGSGKSTTVGMVLGLIRPTSGEISICGQSLAGDPSLVSRHVGAIIESPAFYPYLSGRDNLRAHARVAGGVTEDRIDELLRLVGMSGRASGKYKTFSLGMKQRIGIASTLLTNPALVILDEPTNGLDPAGQREIRSIVPRLAEEGHSVLLASHLLHDVEQVSDTVVIIHHGRKLKEGRVADLLEDGGNYDIHLEEGDRDAAAAVIRTIPGVEAIDVVEAGLVVSGDDGIGRVINRSLMSAGIHVGAISLRRRNLEDLFLELTADPPGDDASGVSTEAR